MFCQGSVRTTCRKFFNITTVPFFLFDGATNFLSTGRTSLSENGVIPSNTATECNDRAYLGVTDWFFLRGHQFWRLTAMMIPGSSTARAQLPLSCESKPSIRAKPMELPIATELGPLDDLRLRGPCLSSSRLVTGRVFVTQIATHLPYRARAHPQSTQSLTAQGRDS